MNWSRRSRVTIKRSMIVGFVLVFLIAPAGGEELQIDKELARQIDMAIPKKALVTPQQPRKLLVFTLCRGYRHESIPTGAFALKAMGETTGAFKAMISDDIRMFEMDNLRSFDAVCFNNTTGELFLPPDFDKLSKEARKQARAYDKMLKNNLLSYVREGGGVVGIHAATDCFYQWPAFGEMMGGYFDQHPWNEQVAIKIDEPDHPLTAMFPREGFKIADEIYQFRDPYSRSRLRVLLSLDTSWTDMTKKGIKRTDGDFAVSWIRRFGRGSLFYCSLGHRHEVYHNPAVLRHFLAGIQFALGDLKANAIPSERVKSQAALWKPLFNGDDLAGWQGLVGNPESRAAMKPEELAAAQKEADDRMRKHWSVEGGVLLFDGKGANLCTVDSFSDFELELEYKIEKDGDSGIYLRGSPQVQIWDADENPVGSGGLYNNQSAPSKPMLRADKPIGEWNKFNIKMIGDRVWVELNGYLVVDGVTLENHWNRDKPIYSKGPIELQAHNSPLAFRNIRLRELTPSIGREFREQNRWQMLFGGEKLDAFEYRPQSWAVEDQVLALKGGGYIWTKERFGDFILDLEFKVDKGSNSGIFFRTGDTADAVQTGIEWQILDSHGKKTPGRGDCGAIYDCLAPRINAVNPPGEWNRVVLECRGPVIRSFLNGVDIIDMNLMQWTEPYKNPDGSKNKFKSAYKDMPREGHVGFQDHLTRIWYRNIYIKSLSDSAVSSSDGMKGR